ncbi:MAG: hypothetical protein Fur0043_12680 [Anaerolineales bacterium]
MRNPSVKPPVQQAGDAPFYVLRLFVAGDEPNSARAKAALRRLSETHLRGRCEIQIIDVYQDYQAAIDHQIVIVPCLVVVSPPPGRTIVGSLKDEASLLAALEISA